MAFVGSAGPHSPPTRGLLARRYGFSVEAINDLYRHELRLWMNLYLPSVKLVKKVRVGSKVRRVYDAAQTPLQRVLAGAQAKPERVAELKKLRQSLDPFQLGKWIDQKLQRIYDMANRRLSPKATAENHAARQEKTQRGRRNGCGTAAATAGLRLHFQCLDGRTQGYIFKWLDTEGSSDARVHARVSVRRASGLAQNERNVFGRRLGHFSPSLSCFGMFASKWAEIEG